MKLYAIVTSERASKGQGGNEFLDIEVSDENKRDFLKIRITPSSKSPDGDEQFLIAIHGSIIKRVYACHKYRPLYVWSAHAKNMCNFIKLVSPYMKIKKHQCELAMEMYSTFNKESHRSLKVPENVKSRRFEIYNLIKSMHSRKGNSYAYKTIE